MKLKILKGTFEEAVSYGLQYGWGYGWHGIGSGRGDGCAALSAFNGFEEEK